MKGENVSHHLRLHMDFRYFLARVAAARHASCQPLSNSGSHHNGNSALDEKTDLPLPSLSLPLESKMLALSILQPYANEREYIMLSTSISSKFLWNIYFL